jgi:hypothetical protein
MRRVLPFAFALALGFLAAGCGDRSLILTVNILSFLTPSETSAPYSVPGGLPSATFDIADQSVNLLQGVDDVTDIASATLDIGASFDNTTGTATGTLLFYAVPDSSSPFASTPIASIPITLAPGTITNVSTQVTSDALAQALVSDRARIGIRVSLDTSATSIGQFVAGTETITQLVATVVTKKKM